jgi:hypothetical protein
MPSPSAFKLKSEAKDFAVRLIFLDGSAFWTVSGRGGKVK